MISALARQAGQLTAQAGQRVSEDVQREVEETLQAVLADLGAAAGLLGSLTSALIASILLRLRNAKYRRLSEAENSNEDTTSNPVESADDQPTR